MPSNAISADLVDYVRDLFAPDDPELRRLTTAAHEFDMPSDWEISSDVGQTFQLLCRAINAQRVLEFGTLAGHSAIWFARAVPPCGKVVSVELHPAYAAFAREQLDKTPYGVKVEIRVSAAMDALALLEREVRERAEPYDVIFLDADKAHYPEFLAWSTRVLRPGGLLLADNVLQCGSWHGQTLLDPAANDPRIRGIREFNRLLATDTRFTSMIIPLRAGIAVGLYHP